MRTPEKTLHLWELMGGFPGAALAQQFYRHKSKKKSYQIEFAIAIAIHVFVVFYLIFSWR
ncbi:MAG TPA: hypothetical protein DEP38_07470 [Cyanobacteria bacterium UBA9226]|nr:hypothetical protein [Cyanobacteria bacterium UBA9226]